jgi:hypothetical protein
VLAGIAADVLVVVHLAFVVFAIAGGLLVLRWPAVALAHLPAAAWAVWIETTAGICPLTPLENDLRRAAGEAGYAGDFVDHWIMPVLYPAGLTPQIQQFIGVGVLVLNLAVYAAVLRRRRRGA